MADNSEFRVRGFNILPLVVKNLLIINGLFFLATLAFDKIELVDLTDVLGLHFFTAQKFHFYHLVSYMFMHGSISHIFFNMFALWMFGSALENHWGSKRFLLYYFITGIGAGIVQEISWAIELRNVLQPHIEMINFGGQELIPKAEFLDRLITVGASGSVYGLLLAFGMIFPNAMIYIYFLFPMKAKWFVVLYGVIELFSGITGTNSGIAHFAHLGGMIFGFFLILYWRNKAKRKAKQRAEQMQQYYFHQNY
jgi:membrane associated rhomboid family serine protease